MGRRDGQPTRDVHGAARKYLQRGYQPVPVLPRSKACILKGWRQFTCSPEDVPEHFDEDGNIGLILGSRSQDLVDVDLDCPEARTLAPAFLPPTDMIHGRETSPRSHWYYLSKIPGHVGFTAEPHGMLVELRTNGNQTVVPPSLHEDTGERVTWSCFGKPAPVEPAALRRAVERLAAACLLARSWPAEGSRHKCALALAGWLRRNWPEEEVCHFIQHVAEAAGDEEAGKRVADARSTARALESGAPVTGAPRLAELVGQDVVQTLTKWLGLDTSAPPAPGPRWNDPRPVRDDVLPPFPIEVFPSWLGEWVRAQSVATQTPPDVAGMLSLAVLATAARGFKAVRVRDQWEEELSLYVLVVLPSGSRKSQVLGAAVAPVKEFERELRNELVTSNRDARERRRMLEERLTAARKKADKLEGEEQARAFAEVIRIQQDLDLVKIAPDPILFVDDVTSERLATLLRDHGGRMSILSAEGQVFEVVSGLYSNGAPNLGVLLQGHTGETVRVARQTREDVVVPSAHLSIGVAVQPDVLKSILDRPALRGRGLCARFLFVLPENTLGRRQVRPPCVPEPVARAYAEGVTALLRSEGSRVIDTSPEADSALEDFERRLEPHLGPHGDLASVVDWAAKLAGAVARLAGLFHLVDGERDGPVLVGSMARAITLAHYLIPHARIALGGKLTLVEDAEYVLAWFKRTGQRTVKKRDLHRALISRFKRSEGLDTPLRLLEDRGWVRQLPARREREARGRKPSPTYEANPRLWGHPPGQNGQNGQNDGSPGHSGDSVHSVPEEEDADPDEEAPGSIEPTHRDED